MSPTATPPRAPATSRSVSDDHARRRGLRRMRAVALGLLVLAAVIFWLTLDGEGWQGYVHAAAEAAMVGAVADWFAVTALFRHPLRLPIPHTAIIPRRKAALGASLQEFVAENFLVADVVRDRVLDAGAARQIGGWLAEPEHADRVVRIGARVTGDVLERIGETDVTVFVEHTLLPRLAEEELAPVVGQLLGEVVDERAHQPALDLVLEGLHRWLLRHGDEVTELVGQRAPWWTPSWVDEQVSARVHLEALRWVAEIREEPDHRARVALDAWLTTLARSLQDDPATRQRADRLLRRLLEQPKTVATAVAVWEAVRRAMVEALGEDDGVLRRRAHREVRALGERLRRDPELGARVDGLFGDAAAYIAEHYGPEIATVISVTVDRWDGQETADRVELHVGRDLQFIRINGTLVGGLVGLLIHTVVQLV